nr:MAG TPA: hypothetical protein [Caudoviricetes sp.]
MVQRIGTTLVIRKSLETYSLYTLRITLKVEKLS